MAVIEGGSTSFFCPDRSVEEPDKAKISPEEPHCLLCYSGLWEFLLPAYGWWGNNPIYPHTNLTVTLFSLHHLRRSPAYREWDVVAHFRPILSLWRIAAAVQVVLLALLWEKNIAEAELVQCSSVQNSIVRHRACVALIVDLGSISIPQFWYCFHVKLLCCHGCIIHTYRKMYKQ